MSLPPELYNKPRMISYEEEVRKNYRGGMKYQLNKTSTPSNS